MKISDIEQLVDIVKNARISELTLSTGSPGEGKVIIRKPNILVQETPAPMVSEQVILVKEAVEVETQLAEPGVYISAPMVGIFHGIDSLNAVGSTVRSGQVVGAIESMKLMNDIISEYDGVITEILVEDGAPVEYGHNLFKLQQI